MPRKFTYVLNPKYPLLGGSGAAHATPDGDALACGTAVEGAEDESGGLRAVQSVETCPVDVAGGRWEGIVGVPEEGGGVG